MSIAWASQKITDENEESEEQSLCSVFAAGIPQSYYCVY